MAFIYDLTDTWNAGGTTFNAIRMNVTDTASAAASKLITLQVGGSERFGVDKAGIGTFSSVVRAAGGSATAPAFSFGTDTNTGIFSPAADTLAFAEGGVEVMRIDASGNVGIGASPAANTRLYVRTAALTDTAYYADNGANSGYTVRFASALTSIGNDFGAPLALLTNNTERMRITAAGNVGIGTTSPSGRLHVTEANKIFDTFGNLNVFTSDAATVGAGGAIALGGNNGAGGTSPYPFAKIQGIKEGATNTWNGALLFGTTASNSAIVERMRIDSSGNLLVGTTIPQAGFAVVRDNNLAGYFENNSFAASPTVMVWNKDATSGRLINFRATGSFTSVGMIESNGTTTTYGTSSDARLKENITDADDAAELIDALQVRQFDWKSNGKHERYGFVAQELVKVAPEAVQVPQDEDEMMGVDYSKLVPMLVKEVQSLRARVAQLEGN